MNGTEERTLPPENTYIGSVLFFKHLILAVVILLILIPTVLSGVLFARTRNLEKQLDQLTQRLENAGLSSEVSSEDPVPTATPKVAETPAYTYLYPELYAPAADLASEDVSRSVYLTFDDGPSAQTDLVLSILDRYDVKATFFVVGASDEAGLQRMRAITEAGHSLGVHSYTHEYQTIYASVEAYLKDFNEMYCQILEATGVAPRIFRFPGGSINSYNGGLYQEIIAEMTRRGFVYFDWNSTNGDAASAKLQSAQSLATTALQSLGYRRVILLMHDGPGKTTTPQALPSIIEGYRNAGYTFLPLLPETRPITFGYKSVDN